MMAFAGCGNNETAQSIIEQVKANTQNADSAEAKMMFEMEMNVSESTDGINVDMDMKMSLDMEMQATTDPAASHMTIKYAAAATGMNMDMDMEAYQVEEDGETVVYGFAQDAWTRTVLEDTIDADAIAQWEVLLDLEYSLEEKTKKVNGTEAYVLSTTITGKNIMSFLESYLSAMEEGFSMEELGELNIEDLSADVKYYVNKAEMLPLKVTIDFGDSLGKMFEGMEGAESVDFKKAYAEVEFTGINTVDAIEVPQEVKDAAKEEEVYDYDEYEADDDDTKDAEIAPNENGDYVLYNEEQSASMTVSTPEGFKYSYSSAEHGSLYFYDNKSIDVSYFIDDYYTDDDMAGEYEHTYDWMSADEDYQNVVLNDVQTVTVGTKEVSYRKLTYNYSETYFCTDYIAWTITDGVTYSVEIEVFDEDSSPIDDSIVTEMFSNINFDTTI